MTREEMHALIAEKLEDWVRDPQFTHWPCGKERRYPGQTIWKTPDGKIVSGQSWDAYPSYSSDLNLCARAEAKIKERGLSKTYGMFLTDPCDFDQYNFGYDDIFQVATITASARVDAMVKLLESLA